jgi:hypothetical protein
MSQTYLFVTLGVLVMVAQPNLLADAAADLLKGVTFYASFDKDVKGDFGSGDLTLSTRFNHKTEKGAFVFEKGYPQKAFRIAPGKGISGGALEAVDVLPDNGRIFFPAKGNIGYKKGGWNGTLSVWINHDPDTQLKTGFCDPVQITQKGAGNGAIWFDYNDAKPNRNLRMGTFPAIGEGRPPIQESREAFSPMVWGGQAGFQGRRLAPCGAGVAQLRYRQKRCKRRSVHRWQAPGRDQERLSHFDGLGIREDRYLHRSELHWSDG